jgi:UPF0755 protein
MLKRILRTLVIFAAVVSGITGYFYYTNFIGSNVDTKGQECHIFIPKDSDENILFTQLAVSGVIKDMTSLGKMIKLKKLNKNNIFPGKYKIESGWSNNKLINHLRAGNGRLDAVVQFHNVQTVEQLSGKMAAELLVDSTEVLSWLNSTANISKYGFNENTFLSMFIPNSYYVDVDITVQELMYRMAKEYKAFWTDDRVKKAKACGLSQSEVVTLASIVYWETKVAEDMPIVAGVYMNRLRVRMPLQADPTLVYALERMGRGKVKRVLNADKKIDHPYNTYKNAGLPPGPILVPPGAYVDAVLNHQKHGFYYFVAKEDFSGRSYFAKNYKQHLIYARRYQKALNKMKVYR